MTVADVAGYSDLQYTAGGADVNFSGNGSEGCTFSGVDEDELFTCFADYRADPVTFTLTKNWDLTGVGGDLLALSYFLEIQCTQDIVNWAPNGALIPNGTNNNFVRWTPTTSISSIVWVSVLSTAGSTPQCRARERISDSSVESTGCSTSYESIPVGETRACIITNTVFFEGIPTLNQYGLAILAVLMLGVGFVGFRRFV